MSNTHYREARMARRKTDLRKTLKIPAWLHHDLTEAANRRVPAVPLAAFAAYLLVRALKREPQPKE